MIGILLISTRLYKQFVNPLIKQIDEFFLPGHEKWIFNFTDETQKVVNTAATVEQIIIPDYKWPLPTLYRYKIFFENERSLKRCSHLAYLDVDMAIVENIGEEILGEGLTVVRHPGFYALGGWGSNSVHPESKAFIPVKSRDKYFAGGFQAGRTDVFLEMCKTLAENIDDDEKRGIIAEHNDESHLNWYLYKHPEIPRIELTPSYCMPEQIIFKKSWGLAELPSIILALSKNHAEIRS